MPQDAIDFACAHAWRRYFGKQGLGPEYPPERLQRLPDITALELQMWPEMRRGPWQPPAPRKVTSYPPIGGVKVTQAPRLKGGFDVDAASN